MGWYMVKTITSLAAVFNSLLNVSLNFSTGSVWKQNDILVLFPNFTPFCNKSTPNHDIWNQRILSFSLSFSLSLHLSVVCVCLLVCLFECARTFMPADSFSTIWNNKFKIKSVAYSSQGSHTGQLDFRNWLADGSTTGYLKQYAYEICFLKLRFSLLTQMCAPELDYLYFSEQNFSRGKLRIHRCSLKLISGYEIVAPIST